MELIGALVTHIDDFMHCREDSFSEKVMDKIKAEFFCRKNGRLKFKIMYKVSYL